MDHRSFFHYKYKDFELFMDLKNTLSIEFLEESLEMIVVYKDFSNKVAYKFKNLDDLKRIRNVFVSYIQESIDAEIDMAKRYR